MKKSVIALPIIIITFLCGRPVYSADGYHISVKLAGLQKDSLYYLANYFGDKQYLRDSSKANASGLIEFKGKEKLEGGMYLFVFPNHKYFEIIIDKEQTFSVETDTIDPVKNMKIKNSEDNRLFYEYLNFIMVKQKESEALQAELATAKTKNDTLAVQKKMDPINTQVKDYKLKFMSDHPECLLSKIFKTSQEPEVPEAPILENGKKDSTFAFRYYKSHYFDNVDFNDERLIRTPLFHTKIETYIKKLTMQMPDSINKEADMLVEKARGNKEIFKYLVWYITNTYETSNIMGMDAVFVHMGKKYYTKDQAFWADSVTIYKIQEKVNVLDPILLGKKVQNLTLQDSSGNWRALYDVKAKYTVLLFWDPDCGHCQKAVPKVKEIYDELKGKGVEVFAANTAVEKEKWLKFIKEKNLNWINVWDEKIHNNFRYEFDINTTPQIFLLDENKIIRAKKIDSDVLKDIIIKKLEEDKKKI